MTRPTLEVLRVLLATPTHGSLWAATISEHAGLGKSTVSQILARLTTRGWATPHPERDPHPGRPPRVLYTLTPHGAREATAALAARGTPRPPTAPDLPAPALNLHWQLATQPRRPAAVPLPPAVVDERIATLSQALAALAAIDEEQLTPAAYADAATDPARATQYEHLRQHIALRAGSIRARALQAPTWT